MEPTPRRRRNDGSGTCSGAHHGLGLIIISAITHRAPEDKAPNRSVDDAVRNLIAIHYNCFAPRYAFTYLSFSILPKQVP